MAQSAGVSTQGPTLLTSRAITQADANTTVVAFTIPAGSYVPPYGVTLYIAEAWAGGTPSHNVGDSNDDAWIDTTDIDETTVAMYAGDGGDAVHSTVGKYYATATPINVTVAASGSDGTTYVFGRYYDVSDLDLAAG